MTKAGHVLDDVGGALPNGALLSFVMNLTGDSATARAINQEAEWTLVPMLLARISDSLEQFIWLWACANSKGGSRPRRPRPIPRPGVSGNGDERHVGSGAISIEEFDEWYYGGEA